MLGSGDPNPGRCAPAGAGSSVRQRGGFRWAAAPMRASRALLTTREGGIIVVTILLCVYFAATLPPFRTYSSFTAALPFFASFAILAAGEVFLMINGEIDLSVGGLYVFIPYLFYVIAHAGVPLVPSLVIVLLIAMAVGVANGFLVAVVGVNSFIVTLGTLFTLEGLTQLITSSQEVITPGTSVLGLRLSTFASIFGGGTYSELAWALGIVLVMHIILRTTRWGLYTIAVGSNRLGAAEAGVRVRAILFGNFVICSTLAGFVGILEAVRDGSITPGSDTTVILLSGIAAAAVGGTLLVGGTGSIIGAFVGAVFLGVLQDGLVAKGVNANKYSFYLGLAILAAMALNVYLGRVRRRAGLG